MTIRRPPYGNRMARNRTKTATSIGRSDGTSPPQSARAGHRVLANTPFAGKAFARVQRLLVAVTSSSARAKRPARCRAPSVAEYDSARLLSYLHQANAIRAGLMNEQVARLCHPHVPDDSNPRRYGPALELFRLRIEADEGVRSHPRLVVPDDIVHDGQCVGVRFRSAG